MIIICLRKILKVFNQNIYNNIVHSLNHDELTCPSCNVPNCFHHHGSYPRSIFIDDEKTAINIFRLKCTACGATHALLISNMIPYANHLYTVNHPLDGLYDSNIFDEDFIEIYSNTCKERARSYGCLFLRCMFPT